MIVDGQLIESLLVALGQQDANTRSIVNGILDVVSKCNALIEQSKLTEARLVLVANTGDELAREIAAIRIDLATLPEIHVRLSALEGSEASQNAALRDMAQVVVGHSEAAGDAIEKVHALAGESREVAREVSAAVRVMTENGGPAKRTGIGGAIDAFREAVVTIVKLPWLPQLMIWIAVMLALVVGILIAGSKYYGI